MPSQPRAPAGREAHLNGSLPCKQQRGSCGSEGLGTGESDLSGPDSKGLGTGEPGLSGPDADKSGDNMAHKCDTTPKELKYGRCFPIKQQVYTSLLNTLTKTFKKEMRNSLVQDPDHGGHPAAQKAESVSYTHLRSPRDKRQSRMPSSA